ncbi:hypothetical protein, partial [Streptomyces botrytidirepellens]|uniref:hypothetical protein n=1 Tax=Streptomyces botrytidirepellens TaxID=2486417 RepID=UPI001C83C1F0
MGGYVTSPDPSRVGSPVDVGGVAAPDDEGDEGPVVEGPVDAWPVEGLVAGAAGGGLPGRRAAAAAPPPAMTRQAPAASAA